jgi:N-acetylmuramoyl-L-alanine amidase
MPAPAPSYPGAIQAPSGNHGGRFGETPRIVVMHYTASTSTAGSVAWLRTPASKASAHVVIAQDGTVTQLVPFDLVAWHAGKSELRDLRGLNLYSWGIELTNPGPCQKVNHKWYAGGHLVPKPYLGKHKHGGPWEAWAPFPEAQLAAAVALVRWLGAQEVVGHDDIAPGRKYDPGPAFPMDAFIARCIGTVP